MALKAGYKGFKKLISPLKLYRPGELGIDQDALVDDLNSEFFLRSEQAVLGAVNLFYYTLPTLKAINTAGTWSDNVYTWRNVQFTVNADLSITAHKTGDLTQEAYINVAKYTQSNRMPYEGENVTLTGCPSGGGSSKYRIKFEYGNGTSHQFDNGGGVTFVADMPASGDQYVYCSVISITDDITFKPMARLASNPNATFVSPYAMTNRELTELAKAISTPNDGVIQVGKLVVLNKAFTLTSNLASGWNENRTDITFPKPIAYVPVLVYSGISYYQGLLGTAGNNIKISSAVNSGDTITICAAYITDASAANRSLPEATRETTLEEVTPEEAPTTRSTKKSTKKTASADTNE